MNKVSDFENFEKYHSLNGFHIGRLNSFEILILSVDPGLKSIKI